MSALEGLSARSAEISEGDPAISLQTQELRQQIDIDPAASHEPLVVVGDRVTVTTPDGGGFYFNPGHITEIYGVPCLVGMHSPVFEKPLLRREGEDGRLSRTHLTPGTLVAVPVGEMETIRDYSATLSVYTTEINSAAFTVDWQHALAQRLDVWRVGIERFNDPPVNGYTITSVFEFEWSGTAHNPSAAVGRIATLHGLLDHERGEAAA